MTSHFPFKKMEPAPCIFEFVYFARPDSHIFGKNVYQVRKELGRQLAREHRVEADIVIPVPDSGVPAAMGYAEESGIRFELGLIRNHYVGRTFIEPPAVDPPFRREDQAQPGARGLEGEAGGRHRRFDRARHHLAQDRQDGPQRRRQRGACADFLPPTSYPCYYGIDTPTRKELISSSHTMDEISRYITADSLGYLSKEGLVQVGRRLQHQLLPSLFLRGIPG